MDQSGDGYNQRRIRLVPQGCYIISQGQPEDPNTRYAYQSSNYPTGTIGPYSNTTGPSQPQILRIAPRVVYNLRSGEQQHPSRRGSVDSGLATIYRGGRRDDGAPRIIQIGPNYQGEGGNSGPRVIRTGSGYPTTQVYHIGSGQDGRIITGPDGRIITGPDGRIIIGSDGRQQYYPSHGRQTSFGEAYAEGGGQREAIPVRQTPEGRLVYDLTGAQHYRASPGPESPRVITLTPRHARTVSSAAAEAPQTASPSVRYYQAQPPLGCESPSKQPQTIRYTVLTNQPHPLSQDWSKQSLDYNRAPNQDSDFNRVGDFGGISNPTNNRSVNQMQDYNTITNQMPDTQGGYGNTAAGWINNDDTARPTIQNTSTGVRLGDIGKTSSQEETYYIGGPHGRRRVSVQMIGRRDSPSGGERGTPPRPVFIAGYDERVPREAPPNPRVVQTRIIDARDKGKLSDFDQAICDSICQFIAQQRQPYHNPSAPWRKSAAPWYKSVNPQSNQVESSQSDPESESNLFNRYKFQFGSIGNFNRSNSRDASSNDAVSAGQKTPGGGPVSIFFFNDFDDMVARMREVKDVAGETGIKLEDGSESEGVIPQRGVAPGITGGSTGVQTLHESDSGYGTMERPVTSSAGVAMTTEEESRETKRESLRQRIEAFNHNSLGLMISLAPDSDSYDGIIRVRMNLIRPVRMSAGSTGAGPNPSPGAVEGASNPPNQPGSGEGIGAGQGGVQSKTAEQQITTFHLPKDTTKVIHISSSTTTKEVIKCLLAKFHIKDNPLKFALYENSIRDKPNTASMRRLGDEERPLGLCLSWSNKGLQGLSEHEFVLQENDTGEILWEAFSSPELENFLQIINQEEAEYEKELRTTYRLLKIQMMKRLKELKQGSDQPGEQQQQLDVAAATA